MASQTEWYTERGYAFGRGSPVRDYWLTRCEGFEAIGTNGQRLGRVERVETPGGGIFLRLDGRRSPVVPASAVERVWPAASMLVIAEPEVGESRRVSDVHIASNTRAPQWEDETLPWWDLVPENGASRPAPRARRLASLTSAAQSAIQQDFVRAEEVGRHLARWTRATATKLAAETHALSQKSAAASRIAMRAVRTRWRAVRAFAARAFTRARLRLGRLLARLAVWVAGDDGHLGDVVARDRRASSA